MTASVTLADSWRLLLQFADSPELGTMVRKTIQELERAAELEKHAVNLAYAIERDRTVTEFSRAEAGEVLTLAGRGDAPDEGEWQVQNRVAREKRG